MNTQSVSISHIELRTNRDGHLRAYIVGTRVRVQDIVSDYERHGLSPEQIAREHPHLSLAQIHAALAFYFDHREAILNDMKADDDLVRIFETQQRRQTIGGTDAEADPLSS